ncbi:hypothetical protein ACTWQB_03705 [Piscibacillus sp. B03]|uniref:hypothetical protein n=1 Tax=Piscibacillus sp. B03 TaxID=3457430 RepID=UPI003FCE1648
MKVAAKISFVLGVAAILIGVGLLLVDFPSTNGLQETLSYTLFESGARGFWVIGLIGLVIGYALHKKLKKRNRIFY